MLKSSMRSNAFEARPEVRGSTAYHAPSRRYENRPKAQMIPQMTREDAWEKGFTDIHSRNSIFLTKAAALPPSPASDVSTPKLMPDIGGTSLFS
jgi:hypothetical protein